MRCKVVPHTNEHQSEPDNHPAPETHGEYQYQNHNGNRFQQVPHKGRNGIAHFLRLEENLFHLHACGNCLHDLCQPCVHRFADIGHNGIVLHGNANRKGRFAAHKEAVPLRLAESALHAGNVSQPDLLPVNGRNQHVADILFGADVRIHTQLYLFILAGILPRIDRFPYRLQGSHELATALWAG